MTLDVTVITPSLPERGAWREECIQSVAAQNLKPVAHLVGIDVDLRGPGVINNQLLNATETDWFATINDDDWMFSDHLSCLASVIDEHDADVAYGLPTHRGHDYVRRNSELWKEQFDPLRYLNRQDTGLRNVFLMRRDLWMQVKGYREDKAPEDWWFLEKVVKTNAKIVGWLHPTWAYRWHDRNYSTSIAQVVRGEKPDIPYCLPRFPDYPAAYPTPTS